MTIIVGCKFDNEAVIIADSRATWKQELSVISDDRLNKILSLGKKVAIAFAGDVSIANRIISQIRSGIQKNARLQLIRKLAIEIPRLSRHYYNQKASSSGDNAVSLMLGGTDRDGKVYLWYYESPNFEKHEILEFKILGSGSVLSQYLSNNYSKLKEEHDNIKSKTDSLILGFSEELTKHGIRTVGGMFQCIALTKEGISPVSHGFISLTPENCGRAKSIKFTNGRWVQIDSGQKIEIPLLDPTLFLQCSPQNLRFHDYITCKESEEKSPWYLNYFMLCCEVIKDQYKTEFLSPISLIGLSTYPNSIQIIASLGIWGPNGEHNITFRMDNGKEIKTVSSKTINITNFPEQFEIDTILKLDVSTPGPIFLECLINSQILTRKALYFSKIESNLLPPNKYKTQLQNEHSKCEDFTIREKKVFIEIFTLCQQCEWEDRKIRFQNEVKAIYSKIYPFKIKLVVVTAFRLVKGSHNVRIDIVNAETNEKLNLVSGVFESDSDCKVIPVIEELPIMLPKPGIYFFNLYIDDIFTSSFIVPAETDKPKYSYSLPDEYIKELAMGKPLILLKRSLQRKD